MNMSFVTGCPERNINYPGPEITNHKGVKSWGECAELCRKQSGCHYWTWVDLNFSVVAYRNNCHLRNANAVANRKSQKDVFSGGKSCVDPRSKYSLCL